ncbi:hypothetical protein RclHR1_00150025 [Rhizophagus clarus]|uniref:HMG box transcription factor n=1 Tax=Rhizophagus clarus TaxID=94130 RepID=A0A2Z6QRH6_9GLOM|nr:hypothetical protein RclHR1_00150025 [Rhizophagus clarus]GET02308.1 HMG box transcription factor [Rhizophagus clarus]
MFQPKTDEEIVNIKIDDEIFNLKMEEGIVNSKTDEEIINSSNYNFTLDIETLLNNPPTTRSVMRRGECYIPRPQNYFMLYRRNKAAEMKSEFAGLRSSEITKQIGTMWRNETKEVKDLFYVLARLARKRHSVEYPNYKYSSRLAEKRHSVEYGNYKYSLGNKEKKNYINLIKYLYEYLLYFIIFLIIIIGCYNCLHKKQPFT